MHNPLKLYIKNMATGEEIFVPANIDSLSETLGGEWNDEDFFGRSEEFSVYVKGTRDFVMSLKVFVQSHEDKMNFKVVRDFLQSCTRPLYGSSGNYKKSPLVKISVGGSFDHYVKLTSINMSYDPLVWDVNWNDQSVADEGSFAFTEPTYTFQSDGMVDLTAYPMFMSVDLNGRVVHDDVPGADYERFYKDSPYGVSETSEIDGVTSYEFVEYEDRAQTITSDIVSGDSYTLEATSLTDAEISGHSFSWYDYLLGHLPF